MKFKAISLAVLFALTAPAIATEYNESEDDYFDDFYGSEEMVEIATGVKTQIFKAPAVANVFTAEQIKNMGATDIDDVLETVPGLHITRDPNSYLPIYTFRGIYSLTNGQALMLINGIPITNTYKGNRNQNWGGMPVEAISRIEVMRGPGSAIFGADAVAGIINIITKNADDIKQNEAAFRAGENDTQDAWFTLSGQLNELKYALIVEYHKTDGDDALIPEDRQTYLDSIHGTKVSNAPGQINLGTENLDIRTELNYGDFTLRAGLQERDNLEMAAGLVEALDPEAKKYSKRWNLDLNYNKAVNTDLQLDIQASYFNTSMEIKNQYTIFPAGYAGNDAEGNLLFPDGLIGNPEVWERHSRVNATALYSGLDSHTIRFGVGYHKSDMYRIEETKNFGRMPDNSELIPGTDLFSVTDTPLVFIPEIDRHNRYIFIQDVWTVANDWELTAGIRHDDYSDFGTTTNPRLALVWSTSLNLSTKLLYGQAFRAPSFVEQYAINNPVTLGNPDLEPEEMENIELAFDYHPGDGFGSVLSFYRYEWKDIIQLIPDEGETTVTAQNFGKQTGYGAEFEVNWQASDSFTLRANAAWSETENDISNKDTPFVVGSQYYLQFDWKLTDELNVNVKNNFILERKRDEADPRSKIDDYIISDLTIHWQPNELPLEVSLLGKNIFDEGASEPSINNGSAVFLPHDLPLPGRSLYAELRYLF